MVIPANLAKFKAHNIGKNYLSGKKRKLDL